MLDAVLHMYICSTNSGYILCPQTKQNKNVVIAQWLKSKVMIYWIFREKVQLMYPLCTWNLYQMYLNFKI